MLRAAIALCVLVLTPSATLPQTRIGPAIANQRCAFDVRPLNNPPNDIDVRKALAGVDLRLPAPVNDDARKRPLLAASPQSRDCIEVTVGASERRCLRPGTGKEPAHPFKDCDDCPEMVVVPDGDFTMGSSAHEVWRAQGEDQILVSIAKPFAVGRFAVTFDEWDACVVAGGCSGHNPNDQGWGRGKRPVINTSWDHAKTYVTWLSTKTGKSYRLLSEAEREYVTRAGTATPFWWGTSISPQQANYDRNYTYGGAKGEHWKKTVPVDSFDANPWGLYNVHGNVWEWTEDCWNPSNKGNPSDGTARTTGDCDRRVVRGGSWYYNPPGLRAANRSRYLLDFGHVDSIGFRVARTLD